MSEIEIVRDQLLAVRDDVRASIDRTDHPEGPTYLDLFLGDYLIVVDWWPGRGGFGVTANEDHGMGMGYDEFYPDIQTVVPRLLELLRTRGRTVPPVPVKLAELRNGAGISQQEVAERMGIHQSNVSRVETGKDLLLSTLRNYAKALGGELVVEVAVPGRPRQPIRFDGP